MEAIAYLVISPELGLHDRVFSDEDIQAAGGIHAIERVVWEESYWFVRLGRLIGEYGDCGLTVNDSAIAALPVPSESDWQIGRRNPAFGGSDLERAVFRSVYRAIKKMLDGWSWAEDTIVNAYALKELGVSKERLKALTNGLNSLRQVHDVAQITLTKHWYDPKWPYADSPTFETVLAEYTLNVPFQVGWSACQELISARVLPISQC